MLSFCREGMSAAVKDRRDRLIHMGSAAAHRSLQQTRRNRLRSPTGRTPTSAFPSPLWDDGVMVGHILIGNQGRHIREEIGTASKGGSFAARWRIQETVSAMSEVRYRLSVRG